MRLTKIISGALMAATVLLSTQAVQAESLDTLKQRGVLKVAVPQDFPPFGSVGTDLKPQGYDIDMAAYLAQEMQLKLELVPVTSANRIPYLQTGKVDLVISSMGKNPEREKVVDFSSAYAPFFLGVFGSENEEVAKAEDLAGRTVGVTRGSVEDIELSKIVPESAILKRFEDNNTTISSFLSGQVSLIATGNLVVTEIANRFPEKAPKTKFLLKNSPCYVGVMKGDAELLNEVNRLIEKAKQQGVLEGFSQKWLKAPFPADLGA
ncbi:MAG: transporter substrate-binding domain-containing protein [Psychromonas sp.]